MCEVGGILILCFQYVNNRIFWLISIQKNPMACDSVAGADLDSEEPNGNYKFNSALILSHHSAVDTKIRCSL